MLPSTSCNRSPNKNTMMPPVMRKGPNGIRLLGVSLPAAMSGKAKSVPSVDARKSTIMLPRADPDSKPKSTASGTSPPPIHLPSDIVCNTQKKPPNKTAPIIALIRLILGSLTSVMASNMLNQNIANGYVMTNGSRIQRKSYISSASKHTRTISHPVSKVIPAASRPYGHTRYEIRNRSAVPSSTSGYWTPMRALQYRHSPFSHIQLTTGIKSRTWRVCPQCGHMDRPLVIESALRRFLLSFRPLSCSRHVNAFKKLPKHKPNQRKINAVISVMLTRYIYNKE